MDGADGHAQVVFSFKYSAGAKLEPTHPALRDGYGSWGLAQSSPRSAIFADIRPFRKKLFFNHGWTQINTDEGKNSKSTICKKANENEKIKPN
jgi:hypothetical protein